MVCFQKQKNPTLGKFWRALDWKMFIYFMAIWNILWKFEIFYDPLVHFVLVLYIFPVLVSCTKKSLATLGQTLLRKLIKIRRDALAAWCMQWSTAELLNIRSWVGISPGCKVFRTLNAVFETYLSLLWCVHEWNKCQKI
jgi:hypothetical protein